MKKENYLLLIKAENRPGLLHLITGMINRRLVEIESISAAKTDVRSIVVITIELLISEKALHSLILKIANIIEVYAVDNTKVAEAFGIRSAFYKLSKAFLETSGTCVLQKHGACIVKVTERAILVSKSGFEADILHLYRQLEGPYLLGFIQTGLIADSYLIDEGESSVIRLAA
ncbi:MAG TPA: acetolactate synthase small subunit [Mucilaginibacter sp.]